MADEISNMDGFGRQRRTANNDMEYPSQKPRQPCLGAACLRHWTWLQKVFVVFLEKLFEKSAMLISKRPFHVICLFLFVTIGLTCGFVKLEVEENVKYLFLPEDSEASQDIRKARNLGFELEFRQEEIIILPKYNKFVLSQECLGEMIDLHKIITQTNPYNKHCFKPDPNSTCVSINLLEIFDYEKTKLVNISQFIKAAYENDVLLMSNGRRLKDNFNQIFGKVTSHDSFNFTNALRIVYFMKEYTREEEDRKGIFDWEVEFLNAVSSFARNTTCANILYSAERSLDDSVAESTGSDIKFFALTFTIMGIFSGIINGRCADARYGHQLLGFSSLLSIYLGVTAALGFLMFLGVPFVSMVGVLPFLVVSIGIDDVFIILHELNEMVHQNIPAMHMLSGTMARSGPTITMTTLTDLVAFAVSCRSIFPAIRLFCTYAALAIWSAFFMLVTFFVGCMWFDIKRINAQRRDMAPCLMVPPPRNCCAGFRTHGLDNVMRSWGKMITSRAGKVVVCLLSLLLFSGGIYGALNIDESFNRQLLTTENSHYRKFLNTFEENFHLNIEVNVIFPGKVDDSSMKIQRMYSNVEKLAKCNGHFTSESISWLSEYLSWAKENNINISDTNIFYKKLSEFTTLPRYRRFAQDLKFSKDKTHLIASRILIYSKSSQDSIFQRDMMVSIRRDLSKSMNHNAFAVALPFVYFEQYAHVLNETIRNLIVAGISILLISSMFLNHFVIIICLLCGFIALILELFGLMYIWNVSVNSLSMINLVMALGFSVDYNAHVAYHFVSSKAASSELRVIDALSKIGGSVFLGGLSTFLGMMPTGFASSTVFRTFFKMFVGIVVLGLLHGLAILPVYLTLLGKLFDFREMDIDSIIMKWFNRVKKRKPYEITKTNSSKHLVKGKKSIPIAIVGIGCRFPGGANSKDAFWDMLMEGRCGVSSYPIDRPDAKEFFESFNSGKGTPGKHYVLTGAFLENITGFDAQFFGISPTECRSMDPQQRLLLQVVYEAIEDAGMRLEDLQQCRTGVYVGLMNLEYGSLVLDPSNIRTIDQFSSTGCAMSVVANRISFSLDLTGPSLTLDTACSSSLVAFDVAFGHLQTGECDAAIVCAPNILLTGSKFHTACCRTGLLAQDGRCKSFDIKGDGYGRGEGVAAVVIKPTQTALDDRDDIYAEVVACGVNNDGQTAIPMTAPSEVTQAILFQRVLQESGLTKDDIQYVEAHGTGTAVGDVVEMGSLATVYGNSSKRILRLGSVKSNINHTESTAGLAGLIKTCLMIKNAQFVPTINVHEVKPQLKMTERRMMVQISKESWKTEGGAPRAAAVSSYGFGGANAHIVVREVAKKPVPVIPKRSISNRVMTLSAASKDALRAMAKKVSQSFQTKPDDDELLKDNICYSLNERYTVHPHRLAVSFSSFKDASRALEMFAEEEKGWEKVVATGVVTKLRNKVVFLYGGQGSQWYGMAKEMLVHEPKFKESIEKIDALLKRYKASWSLLTELQKPEETSRLNENPIGQTALFAIHFALTELLESWGVTPSAVVGHSLGEISAAWASGALRLNKALQLVLFRSQLQEKCSPTGCMAAIGLSKEEAEKMLQELQLETKVDVAVVNSPGNVVLAGGEVSMGIVENHVKSTRGNVFWKKLSTTRAYHSVEMEEIKESYFKVTSEFNVRQTSTNIPLYSTVTGTQFSGQLLSLEHWWKNIRQAVLLETALKATFSDGYQFFIEINAAPQLSYHVRQTWSLNQTGKSLGANDAIVVQTLPKRSASQQHLSFLQNCVAHLFAHGVPVSWNKVQGSGSKTFFPRPTYPWQETEFWYRDEKPPEFVTFLDEHKTNENKQSVSLHPLLGKTVPTETFTGLHAWESEINLHNVPYINDHKFAESPDPVIPAAVYVEMILAMSLSLSPQSAPDVHNLSFDNLLTVSNNDSHVIRTRLLPEESAGEENQFQITIVQDDENEVVLSGGSIQLGVNYDFGGEELQQPNPNDIEMIKSTMNKWSKEGIEKERQNVGFAFGPQFDLITEAWSNDTDVLALICPTKEIVNLASDYVIHPSIIDACFQTMLLLRVLEGKFVPQKITHVTILQKPKCAQQFYVHTKTVGSEKTPTYNITLMDQYARPVMNIEKFITAEISAEKTKVTLENTSFTFGWEESTSETPAAGRDNVWLILRDQTMFAERFSQLVPAIDSVHFVDMQDTSVKTREVFSETLDNVVSEMKEDTKLLVINFWPVDTRHFEANINNFDSTNVLAFENSLSISQEILRREALAKNVQLVFVTSGVVTIPQPDRNPGLDNLDGFPWSASVFGFRRTFSEEIASPKASVVDLPNTPSDNDFRSMVDDVKKATMEEEIVYRDGKRYVNRFKKLDFSERIFTKVESPVTSDGSQKPFKITSMSERLFLQKTSKQKTNKRLRIDVHFANPILQKPWQDLKKKDRIAFAGKLCSGQDETQDEFVVGICKVEDLGSHVAVEKCSFTEIKDNVTAQQAASLGFPLVMSYYILTNLLNEVQGKKILIYHQSEEVCCVFACIASSLDIKVVCLAKDRLSKERIKRFGNLEVLTKDELAKQELDDVSSMSLDAVCLLSRNNTYVTRQIMKHLKSGASVITIYGDENVKFNPFIHSKDIHCIVTNLENISENSKKIEQLFRSCLSVLKSKRLLERLLNIPQTVTSIYDVMNNESKNTALRKEEKICLSTVTLKPNNTPEKVVFYCLPLDANGLKDDRTYLVIGGVRGFGFEVAKWMAENGAKTIMCTARSPPSEEKKAEVLRLERETGSQILLRQADVTSWKDMNVIKDELESLPAVAGIVFTAMVLADQLLKEADLKTCKKVVETKVKGSVILHQLSLSMDLDFFIMFSSISGVLGNVGQVAYSAANSFLDQLCEYRQHKLGLPGLSVNWGPISGAGVLERSTDITSILEASGFYSLHYTTAIEFLKRVLLEHSHESQVCLAPINWQVYLKSHTSPRLQLIREETLVVTDDSKVMTLKELALQPLEFRVTYVEDFIKRLLSSWSGADVAELDLNVGLYKYGIDSIAATNMKLQIQNNIGATFETYYFIQPKTSGLTIINDILEQINKISTTCDECDSSEICNTRRKSFLSRKQRKSIVLENKRKSFVLDINERKSIFVDDEPNGFSSNDRRKSFAIATDKMRKSVFVPTVESIEEGEEAEGSDGLELQTVQTNKEKVIPLYAPDDAVVKVFMIHGSQKSALALATFALGFQQQTNVALYGIGVDDTSFEKSDYGTVLSLAQKYVNFIQEIQPRGPYYLAGYSFGGMVAYEMASELIRNNESVAMVFMVDTYAWIPKALANCSEYITKCTELNLQSLQNIVTRQLVEKMAFVGLGKTKNEVDSLYERFENNDEVIASLEAQAAEENLIFPLKEKVATVLYELRSAATAYVDWQPSKVCYEDTITYICCDETSSFTLWKPEIWRTLVKRMEFLYVSGSHTDLRDETRGKLCGSIMMTTAAMKYQSAFSTFNLQAVRSRSQERLVESLKQGLDISMLSSPSSSKLVKGTLWLDSDETLFCFKYESFGRLKIQKIFLKDLTNVLPGRHVNGIRKKHSDKSYIEFLVCMLSNKDKLYTFRCEDWEQLKKLVDTMEALFGIPFMK